MKIRMRILNVGRCTLSVCALSAMLAGCRGPQSPVPGPAAIDPAVSSGVDLLYAGTVNDLFVFSYPQVKFISEISLPSGGGGQVCSDSSGDVFAPVTNDTVEYAHGGTQPIATLKSPAGFSPYGCAVDPKTGNLAVTNFAVTHGKAAIYQGAQGSARVYTDREFLEFLYCTYDDDGNLFLSGFTSKGYSLAELPAGQAAFTNITVSAQVGGYGIQWDGQYVTLGRHHGSGILYRVAITGAHGKVVGVTHLDHSKERSTENQYWIQNNIVIWPTGNFSGHLGLWNYPSGSLRKIIHRKFVDGVYGATVSVAAK